MTQYGYALAGLTILVALIIGLLAFAVMRFTSSAGRRLRTGGQAMPLSTVLQDAVSKLKEQGQAMSARAVASEQLSSQIVESLSAGLLVVDAAGRVDILNPAGQRLLAVESDPVGRSFREVLAAVPPLADVVAECLMTEAPIVRRSLEMPGTVRASHFGITVSPLDRVDGTRGAICLFSDLTTVFELEEQLRLKETLARLGELTAGIAHEFRNGLATIHGYSRLIVPEALPAQYQPYLEAIRQETEALGHVVTNFLNYARPEQVTFLPVDLESIARRAGEDLQHELPAGTTVIVEGEFSEIQGDEVLLRQVFGNLIRNAAEACEGAAITPVIVISGYVDRAQRLCRVAIDDNGPGIPEAARERAFQPFFTTRSRGTGLGLSIVQKIVLTHNGRIALGTSPIGGASVQLTFRLT